MATYVQDGRIINYRNDTDAVVPYGTVIVLTDRIGVATIDIPATGIGTVEIGGVYEMEAETTAAFTTGQTVYWDMANKCLTATKAVSGAVLAGIAVETKNQAEQTALVRLGV